MGKIALAAVFLRLAVGVALMLLLPEVGYADNESHQGDISTTMPPSATGRPGRWLNLTSHYGMPSAVSIPAISTAECWP